MCVFKPGLLGVLWWSAHTSAVRTLHQRSHTSQLSIGDPGVCSRSDSGTDSGTSNVTPVALPAQQQIDSLQNCIQNTTCKLHSCHEQPMQQLSLQPVWQVSTACTSPLTRAE